MNEESKRLKLAAPALFVGAVLMMAMPLIHPNNTCRDWLEKWGQLQDYPLWLPSHQVASVGFAITAGVFLLMPFLGRVTRISIFSASALGLGAALYSAIVLLHATTISTIGAAYNAALDEPTRQLYRTMGTAAVNYDVGVAGVIAILISGGMIGFTIHLRQLSIVSVPVALVLAGAGSLWVLQYYGILGFLHIPTSEWSPVISFCLWVTAVAVMVTRPQNARDTSPNLNDDEPRKS